MGHAGIIQSPPARVNPAEVESCLVEWIHYAFPIMDLVDPALGRLLVELRGMGGGQDRLARLVAWARAIPRFDDGLRVDSNLVPGCLSKLWIQTEFAAGVCRFSADSDSQVVRALALLFCGCLSGRPPAQILGEAPLGWEDLGLGQLLTSNRRNSLSRLKEHLLAFARACAEQPAPRHFDAHNHLQDPRLDDVRGQFLADHARLDILGMVVNGTQESDWPAVGRLARENPAVIPSFGLHPWRVAGRSPDWLADLESRLEPGAAAIGEIGLDRWVEPRDDGDQEAVFIAQLRLAQRLNLPVTIHCLRAFGRLLELLREVGPPPAGFLLHAYGGPVEMLTQFEGLGAYFSFSGHFAHERKEKAREVFKAVPLDRLLVETDAPDMPPPAAMRLGPAESEINHPGNLPTIQAFLAGLRGMDHLAISAQLEANFNRLFGKARGQPAA